MSEVARIAADTRVTLHFTVRLASGDVVDSTLLRGPATFSFGDDSLLPGFERALLGLKAGDRRSVLIDAKNGFGEHNPENVQEMDRAIFSSTAEPEVGLMISFTDKKGELPGVVRAFDESKVVVDFNHPLAGRDLTFEVEIIAVELLAAATPVTLRHAAPPKTAQPEATASGEEKS